LNFKQEIEFYGGDHRDFETSPFEMVETLHIRSKLHQLDEELTSEEKSLLKKCDKLLLETAEKVCGHVKKVYDFKNDKPIEQWRWHLDKVTNHELSIHLENNIITKTDLSIIVDFPSQEAYDLFR